MGHVLVDWSRCAVYQFTSHREGTVWGPRYLSSIGGGAPSGVVYIFNVLTIISFDVPSISYRFRRFSVVHRSAFTI